MKTKFKYLSYVLLVVVGFFVGLFFSKPKETIINTIIQRDTVYSERIVRDTVPQLIYRDIVRVQLDTLFSTDSVKVPVYIPIESALYSNEIINENDTITYNAYVSGYKPKLDSINITVNYPTYTNTITNTIIKQKRFGWSVGLYGGYDLLNKQPAIIVGGGFAYQF